MWITIATSAACLLGIITSHIDAGAGILYSLRPLECRSIFPCVVFVLGGETFESRMRWLIRLLTVITIAQVGVAALQYLGGSSFGFSKFSYDRGAGLAAGPMVLLWILYAVAGLEPRMSQPDTDKTSHDVYFSIAGKTQ